MEFSFTTYFYEYNCTLVVYFPDVLTQMAATLKPAEFLNILPYDGSVNFFLPYVKSCCRRNAADDLKHVIMEKGAELKSSQ